MGAHKRTEDEYLTSGSIICWSRREDPYVVVICGSCGQERVILSNNTTRGDFTGICRACINGEDREDKTLPNGSIVFWSRRDSQRVPVQCGSCGEEHMTHAANVRKPTFTGLCRSCVHTGTHSTTWRGGRKHSRGYIYLKVYPSHPFYEAMADSLGYIPEHRLVMADHLGRPLTNTEVVHHKNGIKTDNRIENLELFASLYEQAKTREERDPHPGYTPDADSLIWLGRLNSRFDSEED